MLPCDDCFFQLSRISSSEAKNLRLMRYCKTNARVVPKSSAIECVYLSLHDMNSVCEYEIHVQAKKKKKKKKLKHVKN